MSEQLARKLLLTQKINLEGPPISGFDGSQKPTQQTEPLTISLPEGPAIEISLTNVDIKRDLLILGMDWLDEARVGIFGAPRHQLVCQEKSWNLIRLPDYPDLPRIKTNPTRITPALTFTEEISLANIVDILDQEASSIPLWRRNRRLQS
eukprot:GHVP01062570.1.p1 GENE.GHVP01062570.1~~GHVP01062570.1.p1  ORF type:complete len:150 (-),score=14.97 GHVP01062570.1:348-797(-)